MKIFRRFYMAQVFLTAASLMLPTGVIKWIVAAVLVLLMLLLSVVFSMAARVAVERERRAQAGKETR